MHGRILYAALACYSMLAIILQFGWLVPCTVAGTYIGILMDPPIKGGSLVSQTVESTGWMIFGATFGLFAGWMADGTGLERQNMGDGEEPEKLE